MESLQSQSISCPRHVRTTIIHQDLGVGIATITIHILPKTRQNDNHSPGSGRIWELESLQSQSIFCPRHVRTTVIHQDLGGSGSWNRCNHNPYPAQDTSERQSFTWIWEDLGVGIATITIYILPMHARMTIIHQDLGGSGSWNRCNHNPYSAQDTSERQSFTRIWEDLGVGIATITIYILPNTRQNDNHSPGSGRIWELESLQSQSIFCPRHVRTTIIHQDGSWNRYNHNPYPVQDTSERQSFTRIWEDLGVGIATITIHILPKTRQNDNHSPGSGRIWELESLQSQSIFCPRHVRTTIIHQDLGGSGSWNRYNHNPYPTQDTSERQSFTRIWELESLQSQSISCPRHVRTTIIHQDLGVVSRYNHNPHPVQDTSERQSFTRIWEDLGVGIATITIHTCPRHETGGKEHKHQEWHQVENNDTSFPSTRILPKAISAFFITKWSDLNRKMIDSFER